MTTGCKMRSRRCCAMAALGWRPNPPASTVVSCCCKPARFPAPTPCSSTPWPASCCSAAMAPSPSSSCAPSAPSRRPPSRPPAPPQPSPAPTLEFANGFGGFADQGREYVITLAAGVRTPKPWVNVVANDGFGFLASESGSGYTWALNSHENQLTPWANDPVVDPAGEALYLRDESSGELWCPTAAPIRDDNAEYAIHHGQGYT